MAQQFEIVVVDTLKLRDYCLSQTHPRGKHKARVFRSALGLTAVDADVLRESLLNAIRDHPDELQHSGSDEYGDRFDLEFVMTTNVCSATIRSKWIAPANQRVLRFISCFVA